MQNIELEIKESNLVEPVNKVIEAINKFDISYEQKEETLTLVNEILFHKLVTKQA
jgi:hypothetical protein